MKLFVALALLVNAIASIMIRRSHSQAVSLAAAFDMTITVMGLYYWLVVRRGLRSRSSIFFVGCLGLFRASLAFGNLWIGGVAELGLITSVACGFVSFPFLAWEFSILYSAFAWRAKPDISAGSTPFTLHRQQGFDDLLMMVGLASLLEVIPVHLLVGHWSTKAAWVLTGISLYGAIWAAGLSRSFRLRPTLVGNGEILIRFGLMFSLRIPLHQIALRETEPISGALPVPRNSTPTFYLALTEPLQAQCMLGRKKRVAAIGISPDDLPAFQAALGS